ncbi:uncharacterized protein LOC127852386 [Dreissena polymorpha]|uniref:uncharacterized protein LOC127852386 n=1 Tax=Dreissena polymorpha TaxID=45954 RepID=UPI0022645A14|nr:uncharacterized protein LOC127852386 [Dreissena polymorpha]
MVFYCCVPNCKASGFDENVSMHKFPDSEQQRKIWKDRIRRSDVKISQHTRVCSYHFKFVDFVNPKSSKKRLKSEAVPSQFQWTQVEKGRSPRKSKNVDSDETDTASEGEERVHVDIHSIDKIAPLNGNRAQLSKLLEMAEGSSGRKDEEIDVGFGRPRTRGQDLIRDPYHNKGMCFTLKERQLLGLQGLLPPAILTPEQEVYFVMQNFYRWDNDLDRYIYMMSLQDRSEKLFLPDYHAKRGAHDAHHLHPDSGAGLPQIRPHPQETKFFPLPSISFVVLEEGELCRY